MQQPQSRPLLGDSVSSTTSPTARRNNPVAVLTHQQLQQLQQLQAQNSSGQSLTFALQQTSNNPQDQGNRSTTGNHIVYVNQLNHLNQSTINPSGTGMGLPPATPTFGVGLNMGLPLSLLNTSLTSLTSNVITTSNPLLNLGLPSINTGLTTINPSLNQLNTINSNLTSNIGSNSINNGLSGLGQDINNINTGINRLNTLNSTNINSGLSSVNTGITNVNQNLTSLNSNINQNVTSLSTNFTSPSSGVSGLTAINPNINANLTTTSINSGMNQGLNRSINALTTGLTQTSLNSSSTQFPFQAIQSIQSIAPHIVGSNIAHVPSSAISQHPNSNVSTISQITNTGTLTSSSIFTSTSSEPIHSTTANVNHASNVNLTTNIPHLGTMHSNLSNVSTSNVQHISASNEPNMSLSHTSLSSSQSTGFQSQRQYSQGINPGLSSSVTLTGSSQPSNVVSTINTVKSMQNIQSQNISSPSSPFSIPLKSPASNIAPPTPSPSPNRLLLRSPASNSIQSNRNSPSPVGTSNNNFNIQMQSPMQSPMSVSQIQSPVLSPYPPAKSPHLLSGNNSLNNRSPAPGGSPGPPVVRPNTPILQQGMQVLQIIHGTPQGYQSTPTQLVTRTHLIGNQQIQIAATKPTKQPPQILPKPPNQQAAGSQQKQQRVTTTITNQVTQQTQPQLVLAGPQPSPTTATMIPTAQGLLLNQVLPSTGPVIVQQQPGGVQLILRTPASAQQQTHTAQLTQQQLVRVVTAQGMQLQGITPTFFAVPNGFPPAASPVIRHTPSSPAPSATSGTGNSIVIQNAMVQSPQPQISQVGSSSNTGNTPCTQAVVEQSLLPPPKKKAKKKKKAKRKDDEPPKLDLASIMKISGIGDDDDIFDTDLTTESDVSCQVQVDSSSGQTLGQLSSQVTIPTSSAQNLIQVPAPNTTNTQTSASQTFNSQLVAQLQMPVQNVQGQLRFALGEDGRVVLHRTPELNQPEMDQATAQALIRSLTQGGGQNSPIISHLLGQAQTTTQSTQNTVLQRQKFVKSPLSSSVSTVTTTQETPIYQHNQHQQITAQTVQTQNVQQVFEQNLQTSASNAQHNSLNMLQQQSSCNTAMQHDAMNVLQQHSSIQQNTINVLQQNASSNVQNIEQSGIGDLTHAQQNVITNMQQQNTSAILHNTSVQQNVNVQQQKVVAANTFSSVNTHHFESQNTINAIQQGLNTQQNNQHQNIVITNAPPSTVMQQNESQKVETQNTTMLNSAANNILNNAPKITPEILNALSNLNPNDQLLIANANGQMQVISQQLLQQFLAGQLNATNQVQNQNQTQKIVIGEPDANNQNLQGVQINTPTSQIIVNSSGGAPTIQNNIQNIVVQAAPSQMPQHIQIQNSSFPSQFIDNLNQQQIRNLGNNQPKKAKIVKRTKTAVTTQNTGNAQVTKTITVSRPTMLSTNITNLQKVDNSNKVNTVVSQSTNPIKSESSQVVTNGPVLPSSPGNHLSVPSNGQMVQRVQTIQLPAQKQQLLKNIQSQIQAILARKSGSQPDQSVLTKLYQEQAKILASGKVVSTTTHSVSSGTETSFSVNAVSTMAPNLISQNCYKNQTSAVQTQTQTSTTVVTSQNLNPSTSSTVQNNSSNNYMNNLSISQNVQGQQCVQNNQNVHQTHTKQHKIYQNHGNQILSPSSANIQIFSPPITSVATVQSNAQQLSSVQTQQTGMQQSTQCQTDPLDIKPNMQISSPVKQELSSPIQIQVQSGSPAGQVASPRMIGKGSQRIQSPVNTNGNSNKQTVSPNNNSSPLVSPRQGVKRPASSPICRQINRSDLLEQQLKIDQNGAINPDVNTPFLSKRDACKRLVRYHCLNEQVLSSKDLAKADEMFEETAKHLLSKFNSMMNKYTYLLLMESMREVRTSELMMIDRTFVAEEQSILNRLREQEAKVNEEFKKEEKPLVPKVEPGLTEEDKLSPSLTNVSVKRELEDDFLSDEIECKPVIKSANCTSGDYDEWVEIQKELGVYPSTTDSFKCKNINNSGSNSACAVAVTRSSKTERTRANGECRLTVSNANISGVQSTVIKDNCEQDSTPVFEKRWNSATDLERDLLEDTDSLDGLALHSQTQCPGSLQVTTESGNGNEHDDITAQVQSAIDSILNLKKRPTNTLPGNGNSASQSSESKDTVLDQAVRSILGS
ncbi:extracellular matrix-binding protein ebh-like isoform X3 [Frieseomelitta varia]|uniref:extracellular matrix-binding protein ebh-like isoform X3 n=1 Tax=Frieseomelitta varia TaxID=561572 RepID=UPI001CB6A14C|nr:extracellular matrix-binding protein ebh-like isoform X3 [Frieseomelitta varia]